MLNYCKQLLNGDNPRKGRARIRSPRMLEKFCRRRPGESRNAKWIAKCAKLERENDWRERFSSGTAQVCDLTVLIDRHAGGLDSVPIRGHRKCDVSRGRLDRNDFINLAGENIEQAAVSVRSERSEKNGALGKHRIAQAVEARAVMRRLIRADYQLGRPVPREKNSLGPRTFPTHRERAPIVQRRPRRGEIVDMAAAARRRLREHFAESAVRKGEQAG